MITDAWMDRYQERLQRGMRSGESGDAVAVRAIVWRLEDAHKSGDTASVRRWLHAVQVSIAACAPSHSLEMRQALGDVVGLLGLDDDEGSQA